MTTIKTTIDLDQQTVTFDVVGVGKIEIELQRLAGEMQTMAALHGLKQKVGDAAAIPRNPDTGRSATAQDKFDAMKAVADRLIMGPWNKFGDGEGAGGAGGLLFRALVRLGVPEDTAKATIAAKSKAEQAAMRAVPRVRTVIDAIRAEDEERGAKKGGLDGDVLLADLGI